MDFWYLVCLLSNGTCVRANISMTVEGDQGMAKSESTAEWNHTSTSASILTHVLLSSVGNITSVFNILPGCDKCLVIRGISTVGDMSMFSKVLNVDISSPGADEEHIVSSIYLMGGWGQETHTDQPRRRFQTEILCLYSRVDSVSSCRPEHGARPAGVQGAGPLHGLHRRTRLPARQHQRCLLIITQSVSQSFSQWISQ